MRILALVLGALATGPALAAEPAPDLVSDVRALQADDGRVNAIGYRLAIANAPFCAEVRPSTGLLLLDVGAYRVPGNVRSALSLAGDFAVQAVAPGSPAERSGLRPGDELLAIEGRSPEATVDHTPPGTARRLNLLHEALEQAVMAMGEVRLTFRPRKVSLTGVSACHAHFELTTGGKGAQAGDDRVQISRAILSDTRGDDEAAFVMAHELAHLVLDHQRRRADAGKARAVIRETECEADRLAVWLMANAGYDPALAPALLRRGAKGMSALFPGPNHDRGETRARRVEAEIAAMQAFEPDANGKRDWRSGFRPAPPAQRKFR